MKKLIILSALTLALGSCSNSSTSESNTSNFKAMDTTKLTTGQLFYQCPMDLEIISNKSGSCPKCGMDLEQVKKK